jgi:hypothetical protein
LQLPAAGGDASFFGRYRCRQRLDDPRMMEIMHRSMGDMMRHGRGGGMQIPAH